MRSCPSLAAAVAAAALAAAPQAQDAPPPSGVHGRYAPFVDAAGWPLPDLAGLSAASGARAFVLGFVVNDAYVPGAACMPKWGGYTSYHATAAQAAAAGEAVHLRGAVDALRAAGGRAMVSFGGALGTPVEATCPDAPSLAAALAAVSDAYGVTDLDFDVEGAWAAHTPSRARRAAALALLQQQRPEVRVWLTLSVLPTGLTADGVGVLRDLVTAGVAVSGVNVMAMDYGPSAAPDPSQLGQYAIGALTATHAQLRQVYAAAGWPVGEAAAWTMLGVTPMVGVNDVAQEVFTLGHAAEVLAFAQERRLGLVSMWSIGRDRPCPGGPQPSARTDCSSIDQAPYAFSAVFEAFDDGAVASEAPAAPGARAALLPPQPNPTSAAVTVTFTLAGPADVRLSLFDALGRRVATLAAGPRAAGRHEVAVSVGALPAGVYVVRLDGAVAPLSRRLVLTR